MIHFNEPIDIFLQLKKDGLSDDIALRLMQMDQRALLLYFKVVHGWRKV